MWYLLTLCDLAIISSGVILFKLSHWLLPLTLLLVGIGQHRLALMAHDAAHGHVPKFVSRLVFAPFMIGLKGYKAHHFTHHAFLGSDKDPERFVKDPHHTQWKALPKHPMLWLLFDCLGLGADNIYWLMKEMWRKGTTKDFLFVCYFWILIFITFPFWVIGIWILSLMTIFWAVFRQRMFTEHIETKGTIKYEAKLWEKLLFLPHRTDLHLEHHENPQIPCWELKRNFK